MALRLTGLLPARLGERIRNMLLEANDLGSVLRGAASVLAIRVAGAGITFMSMVLLARWMGAALMLQLMTIALLLFGRSR